MTRACRQCSGPIPEEKDHRAVYCSDRCRRDRYDATDRAKDLAAKRVGRIYHCGECGGRANAPGLCGHCAATRQGAERAEEFARLWREGRTVQQLADHFNVSKGAACRMLFNYREAGYDIPYRRDGEWLANIRDGSERRWREAAA